MAGRHLCCAVLGLERAPWSQRPRISENCGEPCASLGTAVPLWAGTVKYLPWWQQRGSHSSQPASASNQEQLVNLVCSAEHNPAPQGWK